MNRFQIRRAKEFFAQSAQKRVEIIRKLKRHKPKLFAKFKSNQVQTLLGEYKELLTKEQRIYGQIDDYAKLLTQEKPPELHAFTRALSVNITIIKDELHILEERTELRTKLKRILKHNLQEQTMMKQVLKKIEAQIQYALSQVQTNFPSKKKQLTALLNLAMLASIFANNDEAFFMQLNQLKECLRL